MLWGAIFDWDGVVIDSADCHRESWVRVAAESGRDLPEGSFERGFGMKNEAIIPNLLRWTTDPEAVRQLSERKEELYRELLRERGVTPIPGAREWLEALAVAGIPCVIGSSTTLENIRCAIDVLGVGSYFRGIVSATDVTRGKPDPQVFLLAADRIAVPPKHCVVFEDAVVGIQAARSAGMKVVAVTTTNTAEALAEADRIVARLDELTPEGVGRWVSN